MLPVAVTKPGGRAVGLRVMPDQEAPAAKCVMASLQGTHITTGRLDRFREYVEQGVLTPHVFETFDVADVASAFTMKEAGGVRGKLAIAMR